ncbi:MAG: hypothetical protein MUD14_08930 [Hydrococcus sp. Prado102]|jgi:hypothetical protein|nr:hypothetical protein [Hydrococcus sp. Prado102]
MIVCIHEDRVEYLVGLKLTLLSLIHHCPGLPVFVSYPHSSASFRSWAKTLPNVYLLDAPELSGLGWNVKPTLLLYCLEKGYSNAIWIDADIIVNRDFRQHFAKLDDKTLVVAQEYYWAPEQGGNHRAVTWGLKPARNLSASVNSGVVRVTPYHTEILKAWQVLLNHPAYQLAQSQPTSNRPLAMLSDQEVLTALLGAEEFACVPLEMLKRGRDIVQCFKMSGYTPAERINSLFQAPPFFIHAMGGKPFTRSASPRALWQEARSFRQRLQTYYDYVHQELTPYTTIARQYQDRLDEETSWMNIKSLPAKFLSTLFLRHPTLQELPLSLLEAGARRLRRMLGGDRNKYRSSIYLESSPLQISNRC